MKEGKTTPPKHFTEDTILQSMDAAAALLKKGRVKLTGCFSEKTGKTYDATVVLEDDGTKTNYKLVFCEAAFAFRSRSRLRRSLAAQAGQYFTELEREKIGAPQIQQLLTGRENLRCHGGAGGRWDQDELQAGVRQWISCPVWMKASSGG